MNKSIYTLQNEDKILKCLVRQRELYNYDKLINNIKFILIIIIIAINIMTKFFDNINLLKLLLIMILLLPFINDWLNIISNNFKNKAAKIQQYIDVSLYSSALNQSSKIWGEILTTSEISNEISKISYKKIEKQKVKDWYSDYSNLDTFLQIFYCQKENISWDSNLRKFYKRILELILYGVLIILLLIIVFKSELVTKNFLKNILWFPSLSNYLYGIINNLKGDIDELSKINKKSEDIERKIEENICKKEIINFEIDLQEEIYNQRRKLYLIPNFFYKINLKKYQKNKANVAENINST